MVTIKEQIKGNQTYYYLEHSFREKGKVQKKQKYLGKEVPKEIEEIKKQFLLEIYNTLWLNKINKIKENFSKERKIIPPSAKEKELE